MTTEQLAVVTALSTVALVVVTGFYVWYTWKLSKSSQLAAEAALRAAEASEQQLNVAWRPNVVLQSKPSVAIANERSMTLGGRDRSIPKQVTAVLLNSGPGPAHGLTVELVIEGHLYKATSDHPTSLASEQEIRVILTTDSESLTRLFDLPQLNGALRAKFEDALGRSWVSEWPVLWKGHSLVLGSRAQALIDDSCPGVGAPGQRPVR